MPKIRHYVYLDAAGASVAPHDADPGVLEVMRSREGYAQLDFGDPEIVAAMVAAWRDVIDARAAAARLAPEAA